MNSPEINKDAFAGKVVLITGASRGIGAAVARRSAELGAAGVAINSREGSKEAAENLVNELQKKGIKAIWISGDIAETDTAKRLVEGTVKEFGKLDVLVNNAGVRKDGLFVRMSDEQMAEVMNANFFGPARLTREGINQMIKQRPRGGAIIFTSSIASEGSPGQANYSSSKGAINSLTKTLAVEYQKANIRVNAVSPGLVETTLTSDLTEKQKSDLLIMTESERALTPEEVAEQIVFLASDRASDITGQVVTVLKANK
jgi:3-oxoacyl-[acyl-carrier protein] reductase